MDNKEEISCMLCLNSCDSAFVNVNESREKILDAVFPQLNGKVSGVLCENCAESIQAFFEFKSNCLYIEECINSFVSSDDNVKVDIESIYLSMNKCEDKINIAEGSTVCRLCMELSNFNYKLLNENRKGEISAQVMVQKCIPKLNLTVTKDPVICTSCYASLSNYFRFIKNHSYIEENVGKYGEVGGTNEKIQTELSNALEISGSNIIEFKSDFVDVNQYEKEDSKIIFNYENSIGTEPPELNIKSEEVCIKMEKEIIGENVLGYKSDHINTNRSNECCENENTEVELKYENVEVNDNSENAAIAIDKGGVELMLENASSFKSEYSDTFKNFHEEEKGGEFTLKKFVEKNTQALKIKVEDTEIKTEENDDARFQHNIPSTQSELEQAVIYTDSSGEKHYKCGICAYETKYKHILTNSHLPSHKDALEVTMHQCDVCNFETKYKINLKRHMLVHKDASEITFYSCEACDFKTKYTKSIKEHLLTHKDSSEITMHECDVCQFKTKHKKSLKGHMLVHKSASERIVYECDLCTYKAKRKQCLDRHVLTHKNDSDITWYQCDLCEYKAKHRDGLRRHKVTHKTASELILHRCSICKYETRYRSHLSTHMLIHKDASKVPVYQCETCGLKTKYKTSLKKHLLLHKDATEVPLYQCEICEFKTRHKVSLKTHALNHKDGSEVEMYKCRVCKFNTKYKGSLKQHMVIHISDITVPC